MLKLFISSNDNDAQGYRIGQQSSVRDVEELLQLRSVRWMDDEGNKCFFSKNTSFAEAVQSFGGTGQREAPYKAFGETLAVEGEQN